MSKSESDSDSKKKYEEEEDDIEEDDLVDDEEIVVNDEEEIESLAEEEDWYRYSDFYPIFYLHSYLHLKRKGKKLAVTEKEWIKNYNFMRWEI